MTLCPYASSGCNGPKEGDCVGLCTHRVDTYHLPDERAAVVLGNTDKPEPISRARLALNTFQLYRSAGRTRRQALHNAVRALRRDV
ncbi:MAG: hypothetical protein Q8S92_22895 [Hydrogenophaga sp.]|uniref:hypothetical protein n=1 Tax=Hydrogenophaga sp. TaxID=1904254 RepID=UPI0027364FE7|nr:hypothetical protein [Hydrogenophaga sp.]MDP3351843.1 hypothetical protein [Hydrogenophaga sp.]